MNAIAHPAPTVRRIRAGLAALVTVLLVVAGVVTATPANAAAGTVTPTVSSATTSGLTVQVSATGLPDVDAAYVALLLKDTDGASGYVANEMVSVVDGEITAVTLNAAAADLDRTSVYEVIVWETESSPDASTIYARGDVTITTEQWDVVFPPAPVVPSVVV
ncbi:MAG: hypothetical protein KF680_11760, partial [Cryobacterium sp.]|nr:hypothetical protein [Cryobacterium sp.]